MIGKQLLERTILGLHDELIESIPKLSYDTPILDLGCGTGAWLDRLGNIGFTNIHGIDRDIKQFNTDRATCSEANLDSFVDFDNLGLDNKKFGLITAIEFIEHLENPGRIFDIAARHLLPNGYLLITTPNIHSVDCRLKFMITGKLKSFDSKGDPTHIYPVLIESLQRIIARYSLKIVKTWGYPRAGSLITSRFNQMISALLELIIPNEHPGDTLCILIQKTAQHQPVE